MLLNWTKDILMNILKLVKKLPKIYIEDVLVLTSLAVIIYCVIVAMFLA